jgi:MoaA/NifB/PqqE/SkfB family radical SAM enzyme
MTPSPSASPAPELVYFGLFDNCNARCNMCDCWELPRSRLPFEHYADVLNAVLDWRPRALRFTGGEPLLLRELPELVARASAAGSSVSVISNGRLAAPRVAELAGRGCDEVVLSIDALGAAHDMIRGTPGLFDRCLKAIGALREAGLPYGVNTVLQSAGVADLEPMAELLSSLPNPPAWWHLIPVRGNSALVPSADLRRPLHRTLQEVRRVMASVGCAVVAADDPFGPDGHARCSVPEFTVYVRADTGTVYGCNMLAHAGGVIGHLEGADADHVWQADPAQRLRARCLAGENPGCAHCDAGSRAMNHFLLGLATGRPQGTSRARQGA